MTNIVKPSASRLWLQALDAVSVVEQDKSLTLGAVLNQLADLHGDSIALIDEDTSVSYLDLAAQVNRYTHWARKQAFPERTAIALLMRNCGEYVAIWAGLSRAGLTVALINTNLVGSALVHSIREGNCSAVIVEAALYDDFLTVKGELAGIAEWLYGDAGESPVPRLDREIAACSSVMPPAFENPRNPALLIYTSGTTGMPKAANVSHARVLRWSYWFAGMMETERADRLYNCLPMHHSVGGVSAIGALLVRGGSVVIRRRFSASRFWQDVIETESTVFQYIGELCRYLLQTPPSAAETKHRLRLCSGNGLREDVWKTFQQRFGIPRILEFYAATEGSVSLYNCDGKPGAIGRVPAFLAHRFPLALVQYNPESNEYLRGEFGILPALWPRGSGRGARPVGSKQCNHGTGIRRVYHGCSIAQQSGARYFPRGRSLVSYRRFDAQRQRRVLLLRGPAGRYIPLERRECIDVGGWVSDPELSRCRGCCRIRRDIAA